MMKKQRLGDIADTLGLDLAGDPELMIDSIAPLDEAVEGQISFLANAALDRALETTGASAVIVKPEYAGRCEAALLFSDNPYLAFARLTRLFNDAPQAVSGIHPTALIHESASIGERVSIAANVVIGAQSVIGDDCVIEAGCMIGDRSSLGAGCHLHANVTLYHNVSLGDACNVHSGTVIGSDGFGFAPTAEQYKWCKIYQLGGVRIGNRVDIGANTCIDRGALGDTVIHDGVIIDNLVHIAHNCEIGANTAVAGCVGMAGSVHIGQNCTFAGAVAINGHISIADDVHIGGMTAVTGTIKEAGSYTSGTAMMPTREWRKSAVRFTQLEKMQQRIKKLEKALAERSSSEP